MKHTKNYMDAMWVIENPEKYDDRDVARANSFIEAYNEGYNKALSLVAVIGQSEKLKGDQVCNQVCDWHRVGHQLNGHQECRTCGRQKTF